MKDELELETYFTRIEEYFGECRGAPLLLSSKDFKRVKQWYEDDIPLNVVYKGIDRYFEGVDPEDKKNRIVLSYAQRHVQKAWDEVKEAKVGKDEKEEKAGTIDPTERLEELSSKLKKTSKKLDNAEISEIIEKTLSRMENIDDSEKDIETVESELAEINDFMMSEIENFCPELEEVKKEARVLLDGFDERVDTDTYESMVQNQVRKLLRKNYDIPDLTLFLF